MTLHKLLLFSVLLWISSARVRAQNISNYWDYLMQTDNPYGDFWDVTDGDGYYDSCGGTVQYFARMRVYGPTGSFYDGGPASITVLTTTGASARSDAQGSLTDEGYWTVAIDGYAYQCSCSQCAKIATFSQTFQGPLRKIRAYYRNDGTNFLGTVYHRCNPNNACDTLISRQTDPFALLTVYQISIGLGLQCAARPEDKVVVGSCMSPDPIP